MRLCNELVQVISSNVIFGKDNDMMRGHFADRVDIAVSIPVDFLKRCDIVFLQHPDEFYKYLCRCPGVVYCPVMILKRDVQGFGHDIELIFGQSWQKHSGQRHCVQIDKMIVQTKLSAVLLDEPHVKASIMCDKDAFSGKFEELGKDYVDGRSVYNHLVGNSCQIRDLKRDRTLWIYKGAEPVHNLSACYFYSSDLDDPVADRTEARRLNVKDNICIVKRLIPRIYCDLRQIIHHVSFYTVDHFERIVFVQRLNIMVCDGKRLRHAVICDGNRRMPPVVRPFYNVFYFGDTVHIAHLCMAVELHTLNGT